MICLVNLANLYKLAKWALDGLVIGRTGMAIPRGTRFAIEHDGVFPDGAAIVGPVAPDMEHGSKEGKARGKQSKQKTVA
ncbi:hypothetical protein GCM10027521_17670 [Amycolatopsis cihanbeyliensis]